MGGGGVVVVFFCIHNRYGGGIFFFAVSVGARKNDEMKPKCNIIIKSTIWRLNILRNTTCDIVLEAYNNKGHKKNIHEANSTTQKNTMKDY